MIRRLVAWLRRLFAARQAPPSQAPTAPAPPARGDAETEFAANVRVFEGLYEPLHLACERDQDGATCHEILEEWHARARAKGLAALASVIQNGSASVDGLGRGHAWLETLSSWGMQRDERSSFEITDEERLRYRIGGAREPGGRAEIELPCWTYGNSVIERGIARGGNQTQR
jgi:hypothetical protein